ncbi:MAG: Hsp70 family protein [Nitrospirae bacterium]|nr:Hsp70 family protein [Nitrospirota bacterium]MBF0533944.1 Hsp70 family protein [Nitrospirota bacterium]MBF0618018.1 Hsp70 family protein [Nitrospirota bacterium]
MADARYIVGIDLGTTNTVVAYIDTEADNPTPTVFEIPQITDIGVVEKFTMLPSFLYIPTDAEKPETSFALPWGSPSDAVAGVYARKRGAQLPQRLISSAKSWLCHAGVDRTSPILPWNCPEDVQKLSPLHASSRYLLHIKAAWDANFGKTSQLSAQDIYLTVPASFDAASRELTVKAAEIAGLKHVTLIEEPLSAFYFWLNAHSESWRRTLKVGDIVLVCDIGGGTTDFTLIEVRDEGGELTLHRIAVGEHILLGGDNMDLMLAYILKKKFSDRGVSLDNYQMLGLIHGARQAKESMLNDAAVESYKIAVLGRGRSVVGGTIETEVSREDLERAILDGFFPFTKIDEMPADKRSIGFKELGLNYATDSAVTRHLAKFLSHHSVGGNGFIRPTKILFNGGVTRAGALRERLTDVITGWLELPDDVALATLAGTDPDLAVSQGAACYGYTKRGTGIRVRGGAGRSYYVGIEAAMPAVPGMELPVKALCVCPIGMEEGTDVRVPGQEFGLVVGEHVKFRFFSSTIRKDDVVGDLLDEWVSGEIEELAPIEASLPVEENAGVLVPVTLHAYLTEVGTLSIFCESTDGKNRWKLEFNARDEG